MFASQAMMNMCGDERRGVKIVDEQTGRIMEGRRWSDGTARNIEGAGRACESGGRHAADLATITP